MRLMYCNENHEWIQLFIDSSLDKFLNLSDLTDRTEARKNLELDEYYWNKEILKNGLAESIIDNICIIQSPDARFCSDKEKKFWNKKVDPPIENNTAPEEMSPGQIWYNSERDELKIFINGMLRDLENNRAVHGTGNFSGNGKETIIQHGILNHAGQKVVPKTVYFSPVANPFGCLGETWHREDSDNIYIGNTGSYTGLFKYTILY